MFTLMTLGLKSPTWTHEWNFFAFKIGHKLTSDIIEAGGVKFANVELKADDGKHENGEEEQQANLQQGDHGLHDGFEHHLQAWRTNRRSFIKLVFNKFLVMYCSIL